MTLIELLADYDKYAKGKLDAYEQALYFNLILIWNRLRRPSQFPVSDTELMHVAGIKSRTTVIRVKASLDEKGFIKIIADKKTAPKKIQIVPFFTHDDNSICTINEQVENNNSTFVCTGNEQTCTGNEQAECINSTSVCTSDIQTCTADVQDKKVACTANEQTCTGNEQALVQQMDKLVQQMNISQSRDIYRDISEGGITNYIDSKGDYPPLPDEIKNEFEAKIGFSQNCNEMETLSILTQEHGTKRVKQAIDIASEREKRNLSYSRGILKNWNNDDDRRNETNEPQYDAEFEKWAEQQTRGIVEM